MWRWLQEDALRPWYHRSWIFPRDPDFERKANRVLDLYHRRWHGRPLRPDEYVLCADEKTSIQARVRPHPTRPPQPGRAMRVEHEYERGGALAYLAAWDVNHARLFGRCELRTSIKAFDQLVAEIMAQPPYAEARRVFLVVDNGSTHRGQAAMRRLREIGPGWNLSTSPCMPIGSIRSRSTSLSYNERSSRPTMSNPLSDLEDRLLAFQDHYQDIAQPFK